MRELEGFQLAEVGTIAVEGMHARCAQMQPSVLRSVAKQEAYISYAQLISMNKCDNCLGSMQMVTCRHTAMPTPIAQRALPWGDWESEAVSTPIVRSARCHSTWERACVQHCQLQQRSARVATQPGNARVQH
jgi:hypothetical protein